MERKIERILVAVNDGERGDFLPPREWGELESLAEDLRYVDTAELDSAGLVHVLHRFRPRVLLSGWSTPSLPAAEAESVLDYLDYLCHLAGAVRRLVPRVYIERGLVVTNWADTVGRSVAEAGLALTLSCLRQTTRWALELHIEGEWRPSNHEPILGLFERRVGIHGFGSVARGLIPLLRPFEVSITAFSTGVPDRVYREHGVIPGADLRSLFEGSDVLIEAEAVRDDTIGSVTEELLRLLPEDGVFVNVGRGAVVDEEGLIRVAREGRLRVGLDVYAKEPLPHDSPLRGLKNVTLFPHIGGPTRDRRVDCGRHAIQNVRQFAETGAPARLITQSQYDLMT